MPIKIEKRSLFTPGLGIRYITSWDNLFKPEYNSGSLRFYPGNPKYIVSVEILADRNSLKEEDIVITVGEFHIDANIDKMIVEKINLIYEMCKASPVMMFALNLEKMEVLEDSLFTKFSPVFGLNTIFKFSGNNTYYCLVNATRSINDSEFYAWFVSYVYSIGFCLKPNNKVDDYAKQFLQAISLLSLNGGDKSRVKIATNKSVLSCGLSNCGELLLDVPGSTTRFEHLVENSIEQMGKKNRKRNEL